jgi:hypothetical protein
MMLSTQSGKPTLRVPIRAAASVLRWTCQEQPLARCDLVLRLHRPRRTLSKLYQAEAGQDVPRGVGQHAGADIAAPERQHAEGEPIHHDSNRRAHTIVSGTRDAYGGRTSRTCGLEASPGGENAPANATPSSTTNMTVDSLSISKRIYNLHQKLVFQFHAFLQAR